jgi:type I restriction-modification system DNA methylase subunit
MILEASCNPYDTEVTPETITQSFLKCVGFDRNPNAADAARLSLSLLHLVLTGWLPKKLSINNADFVHAVRENGSRRFDVVVANPPYIKLDDLPESDRDAYKKALGPNFGGRPDAYLTIMHLGLNRLKDGGFACFVLPQSFLDAQNAAFMRQILAKEYVVHCIVDLSRVPIFEQQSIYNILLIAEKRRPERDSLAC